MALADGTRDGDRLEVVLPQLEAVLQFTAEVQRRLSGVGVDGIAGVLALHRRLKETLDAIPSAEVERMLAATHALARGLEEVARVLDELRRLKALVGAGG